MFLSYAEARFKEKMHRYINGRPAVRRTNRRWEGEKRG
jgi:hypothetical protein